MKYELLGKLSKIVTGKLDVNAGDPNGKYPFFTCAELPYRINEYAFDTEAILVAGNGDLNVKYYKGKFNAYQRTYVIQVIKHGELNCQYLSYFMRGYVENLRKMSIGGIIKYIKLNYLTEARIPLPPLDDQIRIVKVLTRVEALIAKRKESIKTLNEFLKSTFLEMFGDPVRNEKAWETIPMHKVGDFSSGGTPSKERNDFWAGNFPWVSPKDMKVPYISNSQDYISSKVFEETSLKKIAPGHLLIVVRGMILAHSFPTAINTVEISINQDMKAILPNARVSVHYLKRCLDNMKRQILALITTAGHGTKKLDSDSMKKVHIPVPPLPLQNEFAAIVEKTEFIKAKFSQSLTELENLYGSLSQRAFKGELDLSKVQVETEIESNELQKQPRIPAIDNEFTESKIYSEADLLKIIQSMERDTFSFDSLMTELVKVSFQEVPKYGELKEQIYKMLEGKNPPLSQILAEIKNEFGKDEKIIMLRSNI